MIVTMEVDETKFRGPYTFDRTNPYWRNSPEINRHFIQVQQAYFNNVLRSIGYVFLNDVLQGLGFPKTPIGQLFGWTDSDSVFIEFDAAQEVDHPQDFRLMFNVSGVIVEKI